jgi:uncharacterized protein YndB with AHSA1/START domain
VVDPKHLTGYFIATSTGPLVAGTTVKWSFPEVSGAFDVVVREVARPERIVLEWPAADGDYRTRIEMRFLPLDPDNTMVQIGESGWSQTEEGLQASYSNCGGWMHMMAAMKAYLEYGINLRAGGAL